MKGSGQIGDLILNKRIVLRQILEKQVVKM
jgi:hypothetical protein